MLRSLQPQLTRLFERFSIPASVAEKLLEDTMMVLVYRFEELARPDRWLVKTLRFSCLRYRREQRRRLCKAVDAEIREWLLDGDLSSEERSARQQLLSAHIDQIPRRCRHLLRRSFKLPPVAGEALLRTPSAGSAPLSPLGPEDPTVRCLSQLVRVLMESPRPLPDVPP